MSYQELADQVGMLRYKPGWSFRLRSGATFSAGGTCAQSSALAGSQSSSLTLLAEPLFLVICASVADSNGGGDLRLEHVFAVPIPELRPSWHRWLLDRILDVERHETCEFFRLGDERPFFPDHGPAGRLYVITDRRQPGPAPVVSSGTVPK